LIFLFFTLLEKTHYLVFYFLLSTKNKYI